MKKTAIMFMSCALACIPVMAQDAPQTQKQAEKPAQHYYKLTLTVEETNGTGQVSNARSYVATVETGRFLQQIRTGTKIPIATGSSGSGGGTQTQFEYIDLGVSFDMRDAEEVGDRLGLKLTAEVSSVGDQENIGGVSEPVIRQNKWDSAIVIPIGKPTVVFSADDLQGKGKMQVEVTATKLE